MSATATCSRSCKHGHQALRHVVLGDIHPGGQTWQRILTGATEFTGATEVLLDPADPNRLYALMWDHRREPDLRTYGGVGSGVYRSSDGGATWQRLGGGLPGGSADVGRVWVTRDLGATWSLLLSGQPWVTRIAVDPLVADRVYVTLSAYRSGSDRPYLLGSRDGGRNFADVTGNLPQAPVNDVIIGPAATLYVATDQGGFVSYTAGRRWFRLGVDLPMVPVDDIEYDPGTRRLVAATFGRGIYQTTVA